MGKTRTRTLDLSNRHCGGLDIAQPLLVLVVDVSTTNGFGRKPQHEAAPKGHKALARMLLQHGANNSATNPYIWADASAHSSPQRTRSSSLVEYGADVYATNEYLATPLHTAARYGQEALARQLSEHGAYVSAAN